MFTMGPAFRGSQDPDLAFVRLLMHFDGTNGSTAFVDSSLDARTLLAAGDAQLSTAQARFGSASGLFDGTLDSVQVLSSAGVHFGTSDFTIEAFVYPTSTPGSGTYRGIITKRSSVSSDFSWVFFLDGDLAGALNFHYSTTGSSISGSASAGVPTVGVWSHVAVVRAGSSLKCYLNGVGGTAHNIGTSSLFASGQSMSVGRLSTSLTNNCFVGHIDELRVTLGVSRYTADFSPPNIPFAPP